MNRTTRGWQSPVTREEAARAVEALKASKSKAEAARLIGMPETSFKRRIDAAGRYGLLGTDPVIDGFRIKRVSTTEADGAIVRKSIVQVPDGEAEFLETVPNGLALKRVSTLVGPDGITQQWTIADRERQSLDDLIAAIKATFDEYKGGLIVPVSHVTTDEDLLTVYNIADHHLGLFAWGKETRGEDYDLKIAEDLLMGTMGRLVNAVPSSDLGIILDLGDFLHSDRDDNRTPKSGNALDVDTRYAKVLQAGVKLRIECIKLALQKHHKVIVRFIPGNHDPLAALALSVAVAAFFDGNDRVEVDTNPGPFFCRQFGNVLLFAAHGHTFKFEQTPGVVASNWPVEWGDTQFRYAYLGHVHHVSKGGGERHGLIYETFRTLAPRDAWHFGQGYSSGRSMVAITHSRQSGEVMRHTVNVPRPFSAPSS
jgi:hypothetical protein